MKFPMLNKKIFSILGLFLISLLFVNAIAQVPSRPNPPRLVNDLAGIFSDDERAVMEDSLEAFARNTSNQIVVVTLNSLDDLTPNEMATQIGQSWGVGGKKYDNGVVILIKPKNDTKGEVYIAPGYGLEGAIPDAAAKMIIEDKMIPNFKQNDYYQGVVDALDVIKPLAAGEYSFADYKKKAEEEDMWIGIFIGAFLLIIFGAAFIISKRHPGAISKDGTGFIFLGGGGFGGGSNGGSGFGGFGGGGFGGGGAGGSW